MFYPIRKTLTRRWQEAMREMTARDLLSYKLRHLFAGRVTNLPGVDDGSHAQVFVPSPSLIRCASSIVHQAIDQSSGMSTLPRHDLKILMQSDISGTVAWPWLRAHSRLLVHFLHLHRCITRTGLAGVSILTQTMWD